MGRRTSQNKQTKLKKTCNDAEPANRTAKVAKRKGPILMVHLGGVQVGNGNCTITECAGA